MVDKNGTIVNNYQYDEWGNIKTSNETVSNPFKYAGEVYDSETGLYYLRARYYDPSMGRFINEDPYWSKGLENFDLNNSKNNNSFQNITRTRKSNHVIPVTNKSSLSLNDTITQSSNVYAYCMNNPIIYTDPTGLSTVSFGFGGQIGCGFGVTGSLSVAIDDNGNCAFYVTVGLGGTTPAGSCGTQISITNADTVYDLSGWGVEGGASALGLGLEYVGGKSNGIKYSGICMSFEAGACDVVLPIEVHAYATYTFRIGGLSSEQKNKLISGLNKNLVKMGNMLSDAQKKAINKTAGSKIFSI